MLDFRLIGYYRMKHSVLQHNLSNYSGLESTYILCDQLNKSLNVLIKEKEKQMLNIHG